MLVLYNSEGGYAEAVLENAEKTAVVSEINGEMSLEFCLPVDDVKKNLIKEQISTVRYEKTRQLYRVKKITESKTDASEYVVSCDHVFMDSRKKFIAGFEHQNGAAADDIFRDIWQNVAGFSVYSNAELEEMGMEPVTTLTDIDDKNKTNPWELTNGLIDLIGQGEIYVNNTNIGFVREVGTQNPTLKLALGQNIDGITVEVDTSELVTRLYAFGKNDLDLTAYQSEAYIDSDNIDKYGVIEGYVDFSDISDIDLLYARAEWQFDRDNPNRIDRPYVSATVKYIDRSAIVPNSAELHLGQRVEIDDDRLAGRDLRIIKITERPDEPYNTEIVIGQIKKDLFYYFKRFNDTSYKVGSGKVSTTNSVETTEKIVEISKQEVVAADVIEAAAAFIDDLQIERLQTNYKNFICEPNITVINGKAEWTDDPKTWRARSTANVRGYIDIKGMEQKFIEAHLSTATNLQKLVAAELTAAVIGGHQLYFTSITGSQAFTYLTFTAPKTKYPKLTDDEAAMYVVYMRKTEAEYVKMKNEFVWESDGTGGGTYNVKTTYGTGDVNGRGVYVFKKDADGGRLVYTSRTDGKEYGTAIDDDGVKVRVGGKDCPEIYGKAYDTYAQAAADASNQPFGALMLVKGG